jgi:hypothetical protein
MKQDYEKPVMVEAISLPRPIAIQTSECAAGILPVTTMASHFSTRGGHKIEVDLRRKIARIWLGHLRAAAVTTVVLGEGCAWHMPLDIESPTTAAKAVA